MYLCTLNVYFVGRRFNLNCQMQGQHPLRRIVIGVTLIAFVSGFRRDENEIRALPGLLDP